MLKINLRKSVSLFLTILIFIFFFFAVANPSKVFACFCRSGSPIEELEKSTAVFSGRVLSISREGYEYKVNFDVEKTWKGVSEKSVIVSTVTDDGLCGFGFREGERYIVYAHGENSLSTDLCSRTRLLAQADTDVSVLGDGKSVPPDKPLPPETEPTAKQIFSRTTATVSILLVGLILIGIIYKIIASRRKSS